MPTPEFEQLRADPDLDCRPGAHGTLIFRDGGQFCVIGPDFVSMEDSDCFGFGRTVEEAVSNYALKKSVIEP